MSVGVNAGQHCHGEPEPGAVRADRSTFVEIQRPISGSNGQNTKLRTRNQRRNMNDKFDELAKGLAQSVTRRGALKKFGAGFVSIALAWLGLANEAEAGHGHGDGDSASKYGYCI
jgi:hypothetical protein